MLITFYIAATRIPAEWIPVGFTALSTLAQLPDLPQSERALYWAITVALATFCYKLYRDNQALMEKVFTFASTTNDSLESMRQTIASESSAKRIETELIAIKARLPDGKKEG